MPYRLILGKNFIRRVFVGEETKGAIPHVVFRDEK